MFGRSVVDLTFIRRAFPLHYLVAAAKVDRTIHLTAHVSCEPANRLARINDPEPLVIEYFDNGRWIVSPGNVDRSEFSEAHLLRLACVVGQHVSSIHWLWEANT